MATRILTFCDKNYVELTFVWADHIKKLGIDNYLVVAADSVAYDRLTQRGIKTRLMEIGKTGYTSINGPYRMSIVRQYLTDGIDVLLVDADATWEKNILAKYENHTGVDIYASQTSTVRWHSEWRKNCFRHRLWMNCGFLYLRSVPNVLKFFDAYVEKLAGQKKDQPAFNDLLENTRWDITTDSFWIKKPYRRGLAIVTRCFKSDINGYNRDFDLRLCLVSMLRVQRGYLDDDGYVYHIQLGAEDRLKLSGSLSRLLPRRAVRPVKSESKLRMVLAQLLLFVSRRRFSLSNFMWEKAIMLKTKRLQHAAILVSKSGPVPGLEQLQAAIEERFRNRILELYRRAESQEAQIATVLSRDEYVSLYTCFFQVALKRKKVLRQGLSIDAAFTPEALILLLRIQAANLATVSAAGRMSLEDLFQLQQVLCPPGKRQ